MLVLLHERRNQVAVRACCVFVQISGPRPFQAFAQQPETGLDVARRHLRGPEVVACMDLDLGAVATSGQELSQ